MSTSWYVYFCDLTVIIPSLAQVDVDQLNFIDVKIEYCMNRP